MAAQTLPAFRRHDTRLAHAAPAAPLSAGEPARRRAGPSDVDAWTLPFDLASGTGAPPPRILRDDTQEVWS
ncbi:hypothetical protein C7R54_20655 [Achromobacter aloeverae]|uniref:Uncharacterized protein n=1 Tax=Achromobacter aloeverae TaxID=1750518 RepID=A0A4Q1HGB0_9BURK|nr:hypothetical protein C7R54_20655 [Achromobacter aloeverae]